MTTDGSIGHVQGNNYGNTYNNYDDTAMKIAERKKDGADGAGAFVAVNGNIWDTAKAQGWS